MDSRPRRRLALALVAVFCFVAPPASGQTPVSGRDQGFVPYSEEPIRYLSDRVNDPVARLQDRIDRGLARLDFEAEHGYLKSVLKQLDVAVSSQTLVFSKSSFQYRKISPQTPRALYYNDNVYVGWVKDGHSLEIASFDPDQGAIFYLLEQQPSDQPAFVRATLDCTQCHVATGTRGVPGVLVRSIYTRPSGTQATYTSSYVSGLESPLKERFGGWYVTGTHGRQTHMGNVFVVDREHPERLDVKAGANLVRLVDRFPTAPYLTPHSDIVAQMVLAHQTQMHNLITLTNFQTRLGFMRRRARTEPAAVHPVRSRSRPGGRSSAPPRSWCVTCFSPPRPRSRTRSPEHPDSPRNSQRVDLAIPGDDRSAISICSVGCSSIRAAT